MNDKCRFCRKLIGFSFYTCWEHLHEFVICEECMTTHKAEVQELEKQGHRILSD